MVVCQRGQGTGWEFANIFPLVEMILFVLILVGGLIYAWRKGVLEWT